MQNYVNQLVADLKAAQNHPRPPKTALPPDLEFVRYAEEYLHGPPTSMAKLYGVEKMVFPPLDKLSEQQQTAITHELHALWEAFNYAAEFPEGLPVAYQYQLMVGFWDEEVTYVSSGTTHISFCEYPFKDCPFPEGLCDCKEIYDMEDDDIEMDSSLADGELPF